MYKTLIKVVLNLYLRPQVSQLGTVEMCYGICFHVYVLLRMSCFYL